MRLIKTFFLALMFTVMGAVNLQAQPTPPPGGSTGAPVDGTGTTVLLIAIVAYGYMKLRQEEELKQI